MLKSQVTLDMNSKLWHICNNCKNLYDLQVAETYHKGNQYFCSKTCCLEYDKQFAQEVRHG